MNIPALSFAAAFLLSLLPAAAPAAEPPAYELPLVYLSAGDAVERLKDHKLEGAVRGTHSERNSVSLDTSHPHWQEARSLLVTLDHAPDRVLCSLTITEVDDATGAERILSRPTIFTLSGKKAEISHPGRIGKTLRIGIQPRVIKASSADSAAPEK